MKTFKLCFSRSFLPRQLHILVAVENCSNQLPTARNIRHSQNSRMSAMNENPNQKSDVKLGSNCLICKDCIIQGDVTIGNGTIVHPRASIIAEAGPIIIGEHNLIEDKAVIVNKGGSNSGSTTVMIVGNYNVFEVSSRCEALKVGDNNVLESKSIIGKEVVVSNNCIIGAGCTVTTPGVLTEFSTFYGPDSGVRFSQGHQPQVLQMDFLFKVLPNYHYLMKKKKQIDRDQSSTVD